MASRNLMIKMFASVLLLPIWVYPVLAVDMTPEHCEEIHGVLVDAYHDGIIDRKTVMSVSLGCYEYIERVLDNNPK